MWLIRVSLCFVTDIRWVYFLSALPWDEKHFSAFRIFLFSVYIGLFPLWVKWLGREADYSNPSNAQVNNAWSCTSIFANKCMAWCLKERMGHIRKVGHTVYTQTGVRTFPKEWRMGRPVYGYVLWSQIRNVRNAWMFMVSFSSRPVICTFFHVSF
jgi:hypothetical protein